jgi:hypothetical protein
VTCRNHPSSSEVGSSGTTRDQGDRSVQTRVVEDPLQGPADLPSPARRHRPGKALDLVDVVAAGLWLANIEAAIALGGSATPGGGSLLEEQDGHHSLKKVARIGTPVHRPDRSSRFRQELRLLPSGDRVGMRVAGPSPHSRRPELERGAPRGTVASGPMVRLAGSKWNRFPSVRRQKCSKQSISAIADGVQGLWWTTPV